VSFRENLTKTAGKLKNRNNLLMNSRVIIVNAVTRVATRPGFPGFAPCCPASRQDQPRDAKCPRFQSAVKMSTTIIITIVITGVIVYNIM